MNKEDLNDEKPKNMRTKENLKAAVGLFSEIMKRALKKRKHEPASLNETEVSKVTRERIDKEKP